MVAEYRHGSSNLDELDLLLSGHSDRIGALAFSDSAMEYHVTDVPQVTLADMEAAVHGVQEGRPLPPHLQEALLHGTTIGGARPKATVDMDGRHWIAKFSSTTDQNRVRALGGCDLLHALASERLEFACQLIGSRI